MNLYNYWCASTAQIALNILIKHKGKVIDAAFNLFGLLFCILVFVNIIFYTVEMMVWGQGFSHFGDLLLFAFLIAEFAMGIRYMMDFRYRKDVYLIA